jgi:hypothetical protein
MKRDFDGTSNAKRCQFPKDPRRGHWLLAQNTRVWHIHLSAQNPGEDSVKRSKSDTLADRLKRGEQLTTVELNMLLAKPRSARKSSKKVKRTKEDSQ